MQGRNVRRFRERGSSMRSVSLFANGSTRFDKNKIIRRSPPVRLRRGGTERNNPTPGRCAGAACVRPAGDECAVPMTLPLDQCDNVAGDPGALWPLRRAGAIGALFLLHDFMSTRPSHVESKFAALH